MEAEPAGKKLVQKEEKEYHETLASQDLWLLASSSFAYSPKILWPKVQELET